MQQVKKFLGDLVWCGRRPGRDVLEPATAVPVGTGTAPRANTARPTGAAIQFTVSLSIHAALCSAFGATVGLSIHAAIRSTLFHAIRTALCTS